MNEPKILELAAQPALVVRCLAEPDEAQSVFEPCLAEVRRVAEARGARVSGAPFTRYLRFEGDGRMAIEVGLPILEEDEGADGVTCVVLPGGPCATLLHEGGYERVAAAHRALDEWLEASGRQPRGARWASLVTGLSENLPQRRILLAQPLTI